MKRFTAWAIRIDSGKYIGRYWWFSGQMPVIPTHMEGCHVALFKTREFARHGMQSVRQSYPDAKVVKVQIHVEECKG